MCVCLCVLIDRPSCKSVCGSVHSPCLWICVYSDGCVCVCTPPSSKVCAVSTPLLSSPLLSSPLWSVQSLPSPLPLFSLLLSFALIRSLSCLFSLTNLCLPSPTLSLSTPFFL